MIRIIRASAFGGSGCLLNDHGGSSSLEDSADGDVDFEEEADIVVRYLCDESGRGTSWKKEDKASTSQEVCRPGCGTVMGDKKYTESLELTNDGSLESSQSSQPDSAEKITIESAINKLGFGMFQLKLIFIVGFVWMADGCEIMLLAVLAPTLKCIWHLTSVQEAFITTLVFLGFMFGNLLWGWTSDHHGRKRAVILSTVCVFYFGILTAFSPSYYWVLVIRFVVGFSLSGSINSVTIVAEFLPSLTRARCILLLELFWALGSMFAVIFALGTVNTLGWRWYIVFTAMPSLVFCLLIKWVPESPRYLTVSGRMDEAIKIVKRIAKDNKKPMPTGTFYRPEITVAKSNVMDLLSKDYRITTMLLVFIWFVGGFSYYGIVLLSTEMFQTNTSGCHPEGISKDTSACGCFLLTTKDYTDFLWTAVAEIPGILIIVPLMDWLGRKKALAAVFFLGALPFCLLPICSNRTATVFLIFCARAFLSSGLQGCYVYTPEVLPTSIRALGLGVFNCFARIAAMLTPFVAQVLLKSSFYYVIALYASLLFLASIACILLPVETKGRALEDTTSLSVSYKKTGYDRLK
eukprot:gene13937-15389_t